MPGCDSAARDGQTVTWKAKSQLFGSLRSRKPGTTRDSLLTEEGDWQTGKDGSLLTEEGDRPAGKDGTPIACPGKGVPAFPPGRPAAAPAAAVARRTLRIPRPIYHINQGVNGRTARAPPGAPHTRGGLEPGISGFSTLRVNRSGGSACPGG